MPNFFSLSRVIQRVDELLKPAMEKTFWVKAEISSSRSKGGHFYCDLVEINEKGQLNTQVRCTIWARELNAIKQKFKSEGMELDLEDGINVGILCRLQFHPIYGLSFRGLDMDPAFALGELELKKREIIERLQKRSLLELNKDTFLPLLPQKIGLITGQSTAAYEDFINTLSSSGFGFKISFAASTMQGENTAFSILKSLRTLERLDLDLIIICRGGGSKIDLSWLDHEGIAENIAHFKIPVWTGIGHEIDTSVLDYVSARYFKTPTAVAEELVSMHAGIEQYLEQAHHNIKSTWNYRYKEAIQNLTNLKNHLKRESLHLLELQKNQLNLNLQQLLSRASKQLLEAKSILQQNLNELRFKTPRRLEMARTELLLQAESLKKESQRKIETQQTLIEQKGYRLKPQRFLQNLSQKRQLLKQSHKRLLKGSIWFRLEREKLRMKGIKQTLHSADPETQLERGFSVIKNQKGETLTRANHLKLGENIQLQFQDGKVSAKVENKE